MCNISIIFVGLKKFEIEIIDGIDFKVKKYFDIPINNWKLELGAIYN